MCALHKDGGNVNFSKNILYNDFRCAWYAYTKLLNVSFEENFECDICGMVPDIIVCDATSMGYQRKFLTAALSDSRQSTCYQRYSLVIFFLFVILFYLVIKFTKTC